MLLPIHGVRDEFIRTIRDNNVVVVAGDTGSGKTTQLPIFLYQAGFARKGIIGVTEPRRIAATSVARYVAQNLNSRLGELVGYQVRFDNQVERETAIKFMTDGILLREIQVDPDLTKYSVIMIDEAHERSQNIDFTLGLLKDVLKRRSDLKVVVASATIDTEKFSKYFGGAPIVSVSGRTYPVDVFYHDQDIATGVFRYEPEFLVEAVVQKIEAIHCSGKPGDILVFMTGKEDIHLLLDAIENLGLQDLIVLPAYGGLVPEDQEKVFFSYPGKRKVVVATNIAETSITIDGIAYVVDTGLIKQTSFHSQTGIQSLDVVPHSQAGCDQRKGRAGRTRPGICYRMYTEKSFHDRPAYTEPEILRVSIAGVVLAMEDLGIQHAENFDFVDAPDWQAFHEAYQTLIALGAVAFGRDGITMLGKKMARLPLEPRLARMLLEAERYGCVQEVVTVAAFLSVPSVFVRPKGRESEADSTHHQFKDGRSDALTFLRIWKRYVTSGYSNAWCYQNFLNSRSLNEIDQVRQQLLAILEQDGMIISSSDDEERIMQSVVSGLVYNLCEHDSRHWYKGVFRGDDFKGICIHPGSSLFGVYSHPRWFVATELVQTTKLFARNCTEVKLEWLCQLVPHLFTYGDMTIQSFSYGDRVVTVTQQVFFRGVLAGTISREISLTEARRLQAEMIEQAVAKGWRQFSFKWIDEGIFGRSLVSPEGYKLLGVSGYEEGVLYYCETEIILGKNYARPKFRVYNLANNTRPISAGEAAKELALTLGGNSIGVGLKTRRR